MEIICLVRAFQDIQCHRLPVLPSLTPDQAHPHPDILIRGQDNPSCIGNIRFQGQARLCDPAGLPLIQGDAGTVPSGEGEAPIHVDVAGLSHDAPAACGLSPALNRGVILTGHGMIELPVVQHFRPETPVDNVTDMLDELSVYVLRNGCMGDRRVDDRLDGLSLRTRRGDDQKQTRHDEQNRLQPDRETCRGNRALHNAPPDRFFQGTDQTVKTGS